MVIEKLISTSPKELFQPFCLNMKTLKSYSDFEPTSLTELSKLLSTCLEENFATENFYGKNDNFMKFCLAMSEQFLDSEQKTFEKFVKIAFYLSIRTFWENFVSKTLKFVNFFDFE